MSDGGKGSIQRPTNIETYNTNYDNIFKNKQEVALEELVRISEELGLYEDNTLENNPLVKK